MHFNAETKCFSCQYCCRTAKTIITTATKITATITTTITTTITAKITTTRTTTTATIIRRGAGFRLKHYKPRSTLLASGFYCRAVKLWNSLPITVAKSNSIGAFKKATIKHFNS